MEDHLVLACGPVKFALRFTGQEFRIFNLTKRGATGVDKGVAQGFVTFLLSTNLV